MKVQYQMALLAALMLGAGCEEKPAPATIPQPAAPAVKPADTTNAVAERVPLGIPGYSIEIPAGWRLVRENESVLGTLRGPAADSDPEGLLARSGRFISRGSLLGSTLDIAIERFKQDDENQPNVEYRFSTNEGVRVVERIERNSFKSEHSPEPREFVSQSFYIYLPTAGEKYELAEVSFLECPAEQFEADKAVVHSIIESIRRSASNE